MAKKYNFEINRNNIHSKSILNALDNLEGINRRYRIQKPEVKHQKPILKVTNLKKTFGDKVVLKNINMEIFENENVALLGGNGAGKTTLVEILTGLNKPTSGTIEYLFDYEKNFQEKIGIQFQDSSYPPAISVKEVIKFMIDIYGSKLNNDEFNALIKIFGIDEYYHRRASKLSGGQQQRLNVLLALIHKPLIIFLDELSTGLDISIRTRIKNFIKDYSMEMGITVILVSHDMSEVQLLCDKVMFLKNGEIIVNDSMENIKKKHRNFEEYIESLL